MIHFLKPFLPPKEVYEKYLTGIWSRNWLTNMGPLVNELELKLKDYLGVNHLLYVTNGTTALQLAIKSLDLKGEIITTPFSFVATSSTIVWENCLPVYVDIDLNTLNIDASKIEEKITKNTTAILGTHVYGNPCDVEEIERIAKKHNLKVIYDGAHAFGVTFKGKSIFEYGDISICSLHASKLYHSVEGGLIVTKNADLLKKIAFMRNFGIQDFDSFNELGINGKNSEFHAAMGLSNLNFIDKIINKRKELSAYYDKKLTHLNVVKPKWNKDSTENFAYYPIVFNNTKLFQKIIEGLALSEIFIRRYFYPPLSSNLPYLEPQYLEIVEDVSERIICLPLYYDLTFEEIDLISRVMLRIQNN